MRKINCRWTCVWDCLDCGRYTMDEYYMVLDRIWDRYGAGDKMLCIGCLEHRLGRHLTPRDFTPAPINRKLDHRSYRLRSRLRKFLTK